jgi:hypothetical protein
LRIFLIEDAVLLVTQSRARDAVTASKKIVTVDEIITAVAVLAVEASVEFAAVDAFVTAFALPQYQCIHAVL